MNVEIWSDFACPWCHDRTIGASGAHPPEVLGRLLERGWEASASAVV